MSDYIIRERFESNFAMVPKTALKDKNLSLKAKGLYSYLFSLPEDWKVYKTEIVKHFTDGKDSLNSAFKELEKHGYLVSTPIKDDNTKQFKGYVLKLLIEPLRISRHGFSGNGLPGDGLPATTNTDDTNTVPNNTSLPIGNEINKEGAGGDLFSSAGLNEEKKQKIAGGKVATKTLLRDNPIINAEFLKKKITGQMYCNANMEYYYECALAWSDSYGKKAIDWVGTIRNFILKDFKLGKVVTGKASQEQKLKGVQELLDNFEDI